MQNYNRDTAKYLYRWVIRGLFILAVLAVCLGAPRLNATAQSSAVIWSAPEDLSNTPESSLGPAIVADQYGFVHVFWSEDTSSDAVKNPSVAVAGNAIYYTRWDGKSWTKPIDVLYVPDDPIAAQISVTADQAGYLHIVWTGLVNIYYSKALAVQAGSPQAWLPPVVISTNSARTWLESSVAVDNAGHVHIVYATRGSAAGVYHVESDDGETWSDPQKLSAPFDSLENSFARIKIITDKLGRLHAVWQTSEVNGYGQAVYYSRSTDRGQTWAAPQQLAYREPGDFDVGWPYIMAVGESELHLIYNAGAEIGAAGRYERLSTDGGETWSAPQHIIKEMIGINGYVVPVVDGAGQLHLIIDMRTLATQKVGIYYSSWSSGSWSPVVPLVVGTPGSDSAHYTAVAVARGNEIHVVWTQLEGGEIWHVRGVVQNVAAAPVSPLPTAIPSPTTIAPTTKVTVVPAQPIVANVNSQPPKTRSDSAANSPLIPATIAVLVIIVAIAAVRRLLRLRRTS